MNDHSSPAKPFLTFIPVWITLPVLLALLIAILGYNGLYGQDSFEYARYARAIHDFLVHGAPPDGFLWPVLYPLAGGILSLLMPDILSLQIISLVSFGLSGYFLLKMLNFLFPVQRTATSVYLFMFYLFSPFLLRYAASVMTETMALFFMTGFLYFYLVFRRNQAPKDFLMLSLFAGAAINTRYASLVILAIPGLHALLLFLRKFNTRYFLLSILIFILFFIPGIILSQLGKGPAGFTSTLEYWSGVLTQWSPLNYFKNSFQTENGRFVFFLPNILYTVSSIIYPGFIFTGILFIVFVKTSGPEWRSIRMLLFALILYWLFLSGLPIQNDRLLLLSFPIVILIFSGTFLWLYQKLTGWNKVAGIVLFLTVVLIQSVLFYRAFRPFYRNSMTTREICARMLAYPGKTIYTFNIDQALKIYGVSNTIVNIWGKPIGQVPEHSLILFNFSESSEQWKGMNPFLNWEKIRREHRLKLIERFKEGWELYEITD